MKITGTATMTASPEQVWTALHDPAVLARCIPGCQSLRELDPGRYAMTVTAGVAAIKGSYDGEVSLTDVSEPTAFTLNAQGAGAPGTIATTVDVRLAGDGEGAGAGAGTTITYDADATVGGPIGGVGQRMLAGVARKMAGQMFAALDADIAGVRKESKKPQGKVLSPGVHVEEVPAGPRPIEAVGTSTASRGPGFASGAVFGAGVALAGVVVGARIARR